MTEVSMVLVRGDSQWSGPGGLHLGSTLNDVETANKKSFKLSGFDWDYGGYVTDLNRGTLAKLKGRCELGIRFGIAENGGPVADSIEGDRSLVSSDPAVIAAKPVVQELSVGWPKAEATTEDDAQ